MDGVYFLVFYCHDRYLRRSEKRFKKCMEKKIQCEEMLLSEHAVSKIGETFEVRKDARKMLQNKTNFN